MDTVKRLQAARALIDTPAKWIKDWYAIDSRGRRVYPHEDSGVCFCLRGALQKAEADELAFAVMANLGDVAHIADFNDATETTHEMVMSILDKAIAVASAGTTGSVA